MKTDTRAIELHDKATRGQQLSTEEQAYLDKWYALQDQEGSAMLAKTTPPKSLEELQQRVNATLAGLPVTTQRIQSLLAAKDALRQEIVEYKQK